MVAIVLAVLAALSSPAERLADHQHRLAVERWVEECIYERTGPVDGITPEEAVVVCEAEIPTDAATLAAPIVTDTP